ncbi:MAG: hypothetical protein GY793_09750 [Proteobacteria bacterium]|nr:hypothetical protein [Pseudomonadota bacterium]
MKTKKKKITKVIAISALPLAVTVSGIVAVSQTAKEKTINLPELNLQSNSLHAYSAPATTVAQKYYVGIKGEKVLKTPNDPNAADVNPTPETKYGGAGG